MRTKQGLLRLIGYFNQLFEHHVACCAMRMQAGSAAYIVSVLLRHMILLEASKGRALACHVPRNGYVSGCIGSGVFMCAGGGRAHMLQSLMQSGHCCKMSKL